MIFLPDKEPEEWAFIEGAYPYEVSTHGKIRRIYHRIGRRCRDTVTGLVENILGQHRDERGYLMVTIKYEDGGRWRTRKVHRLVALAFVPNPEGKRTVNHEDGDKENNYYKNLTWMTDEENVRHSFAIGLRDNQIAKMRKEQPFLTKETETYGGN